MRSVIVPGGNQWIGEGEDEAVTLCTDGCDDHPVQQGGEGRL